MAGSDLQPRAGVADPAFARGNPTVRDIADAALTQVLVGV
jgi:hypothetical protein